jgi:hypothetical protein
LNGPQVVTPSVGGDRNNVVVVGAVRVRKVNEPGASPILGSLSLYAGAVKKYRRRPPK